MKWGEGKEGRGEIKAKCVQKEESHGRTYSGFVLETLPGGGLFLCFCCVMLELGFVVVARARTERAGERIVGVGEEARCLSIAEG